MYVYWRHIPLQRSIFSSLQYESLKYLGGWQGVERSISDSMSYKNHYMCSGEASSIDNNGNNFYNYCEIYIYQWLRHYTCSGFCNTSYHLLISPPPTHLLNTLKIHTGENKIERQSRMWRQYTCSFPANGSTNPDVFQPKTFPIPRRIILMCECMSLYLI